MPSPGENFRAVHKPVGDRGGHRDGSSPLDSSQQRAIPSAAGGALADDPEQARRAQFAQGKITQLETAAEAR